MTFSSTRRFCGGALVVAALICLSSCAVPLAPGYQIEKHSITVRFVPGNPPHLAIRAQYRLANVGTAPLDFIQLKMMPRDLIGRTNLQVAVDGEAIPLGPSSRYNDSFDALSIPFNPAWKQKQEKEILITYDSTNGNAGVLSSNGFFYTGLDLFPIPVAPKSFFATKPIPPDSANVSVIAPSDFLVLCNRRSEVSKRRSGETAHRFQVHKNSELFILAGHYKQREIETPYGKVVFWTFRDMRANDATSAAPIIAATFKFLDANFEFRDKKSSPLWIATIPFPNVITMNDMEEPTFLYFASGILVSQTEMDKGIDSAAVLEGIEGTLVDALFQQVIEPRSDAEFLLDGLDHYAREAIRENNRGTSVRTNDITKLLQQFDDSRHQALEIPVNKISYDDSLVAQTMALDKSLLLPFALEDRCGRENVRRAIAHMVDALRGQQYGYSDFRAAVEMECGQNLTDVFDTWLTQPGIPPVFRARYQNGSENTK